MTDKHFALLAEECEKMSMRAKKMHLLLESQRRLLDGRGEFRDALYESWEASSYLDMLSKSFERLSSNSHLEEV